MSGIDAVRFSILSADDVRASSVARVEVATATKARPGVDVRDARFGPVGRGQRCGTCGGDREKCVIGHWGHLELPVPVPNALVVTQLVQVLQSVCACCSQLLITVGHPAYAALRATPDPLQRLKEFAKRGVAQGRCGLRVEIETGISLVPDDMPAEEIRARGGRCGAIQPKWSLVKKHLLTCEGPERITPADVYRILWGIPECDWSVLGIAGPPCNFLWSAFPIPPNGIREQTRDPKKQHRVGDDDLTKRLRRIVRCSSKCPQIVDLRSPPAAYTALCSAIASYQNEKLNPSAYARDLKSLTSMIGTGKEGLYRYDVLGKRVNFAGRAPIIVDTAMHIRDVGIPQSMAKKLCVPERVYSLNYAKLQRLVNEGKAAYVVTDQAMYEVGKKPFLLATGMIVERHLQDGDYVLVNRQPSLHRHSMMAHTARIHRDPKCEAISLHLAVMAAYAGDFDGDEVNVVAVRGEASRAEAQELMLVDHWILKDGAAIIGFSQTSIAAAWMLSDPATRLRISTMQHLLMLGETDAMPAGDTGRALLDLLIPVPYERLTKKELGRVVECVVEKLGGKGAADWITRMYHVFDWYSTHVRPVSISLRDLLTEHDPELADLDCGSDLSDSDRLVWYGVLRTDVGTRARAALPTLANGLRDLVESGAKGNADNIFQIAGCLGPQFDHRQALYSRDAFIKGRFSTGLSPRELFTHLRAARVGLMDTAARTRETGYLHRKMAKHTEDISTSDAGIVFNGRGVAIRFDGRPGELPGELAAQGIAEPLTQTNLRTFHITGQSHGLRSSVSRVADVLNLPQKTSKVREIERTLGIEAAQEYVFNELSDAMKQTGAVVDPRHLHLVADAMTYTGSAKPFTAPGMDTGSTLRAASFEQCLKNFVRGALAGNTSTTDGVTESIVVGRAVKSGTGAVTVLKAPCISYSEEEYNPSDVGGTLLNGALQEGLQSPSYRPSSPSYPGGGEDEGPCAGAGEQADRDHTRAPSPSYRPSSPSYAPGSPSYDPALPTFWSTPLLPDSVGNGAGGGAVPGF